MAPAEYGARPHDNIPDMRQTLDPLMQARRDYAYGKQNDFDHANTIGWTREGDDDHPDSGLACIMTNGSNGRKHMSVGDKFKGATFYDITGNRQETITIKDDGNGDFICNDGSVSVWVKQKWRQAKSFFVRLLGRVPP